MERGRAVDRGQEMKKALLDRTKESHDRRDDTGMYRDIFLDVEGLQKWKCKEGVHLIDIIPYKAGSKDPYKKEGEWEYVLDVFVHGGIGVNQDSFVCPARTYKLPCPICEYREELREKEDYDEEYVKTLYPIRRVAYNVVCYDDVKEEAKGIQIWLVAHFHMEKKIMAIAKMPSRGGTGGGYVSFADPDEGRSVQFERKGGKTNTEYLGHQFIPREGYKISDEILLSAHKLDEIIHIPNYDELYDAFYGGKAKLEEEIPPGETEEIRGEAVETIPSPVEKPIETRPRLLQRGSKAPEEGQLKSPSEPISRLQPQGKGVCPAGGNFGTDCEDLKTCGNCEMWDDCSAKKDEMRAKEAPPPARPERRSPSPTRLGPGTRGRR